MSSGIGLGVIGLGTVAAVILLRQRSSKRSEGGKEEGEEGSNGKEGLEQPKVNGSELPNLKSRIGNFKIAKLSRLLGTLGEAEDIEKHGIDFDWQKATAGSVQKVAAERSADHTIDCNDETEWEKQVASECRTFQEAARVLGELRGSQTHKKLSHFYVVDRQLSQMEAQFREISENVLELPWREHRDDPISDLMTLPFMKLAADVDNQAMLPVSQGFVKQLGQESDDNPERQASVDEQMLGIEAGASREALESAFRHAAREMHAHGHCTNIDAFHKLNNAYARCVSRLTNSGWRKAYQGGSTDVLAHYLLIGTDPSESRYGEAVSGLLDALKRERLLTKLDVLRSWGEVSGSCTGLGNG